MIRLRDEQWERIRDHFPAKLVRLQQWAQIVHETTCLDASRSIHYGNPRSHRASTRYNKLGTFERLPVDYRVPGAEHRDHK
jgi:hypothetical protein